jgi:CRP-like cAMP-binding protein
MLSANKIEVLKKTELFGPFLRSQNKVFPDVWGERRLKRGETLFFAGEEAKGFYVIAKGSFSSYRENSEGREQVLLIEKAGATVGEVPMFDDKPYHSTVVANEDSEVLFILKNEVKRLCSNHPAVALAALKLLASRFRETAALAESLSLKTVDQRLAAFLLKESKEKALKKLKLPTNSTIAANLGTVREVVSRAFSKLENDLFISIDGHHNVTLLDEEGLTGFAGN